MNLNELRSQMSAAIDEALKLASNGELEASKEQEEKADELKSQIAQIEKVLKRQDELKEAAGTPQLPVSAGGGTFVNPSEEGMKAAKSTPEEEKQEIRKSVNVLRYSRADLESMTVNELCDYKAIRDLYGADYRQVNDEQNGAFEQFLRAKGDIGGDTDRKLRRMYWPLRYTVSMIKSGMELSRVKATMVEGVDMLGGYAVPPERGALILQRAAGLTAVRQGGATVVRTATKMIEWLEVTQGNNQYPSGLRGAYGSETQNPIERNFQLGLKQIPVHIYTYKVPFSVSLLEDAENIIDIFTNLTADTLAIDEDTDFLIGDGANKARGILPGQLNADGLTEVISGNGTALTMDGIKSLRRGVASQYRMLGKASFIGNNDTGEDIELFKDGDNRYFYPDGLTPGQAFHGGIWRESEALASPAANQYPLIYGNLSGYAIVERLGLTIQRYNDSNTGVNTVEYHIRRRIGGAVIQPWKLAVQKVSSS